MSNTLFDNQEWIQFLVLRIKDKHVAIDATMGNGFDTLFLAQHFEQVIAFDIQALALQNTKQKLIANQCDNVKLILESHEQIKQFATSANCIIFNLGYLPNSDKTITTKANTTINALIDAIDIISLHGLIILTLYQAHDNNQEANAIKPFLETLDAKRYTVNQFKNINKTLPPYVIVIEKILLK